MRLVNRNELDIGEIVNGQEAPNPIPWQVSLQTWYGHFCGATILNGDTLLSAAHCFYEAGTTGFTIRAGSTRSATGGQVGTVVTGILHTPSTQALCKWGLFEP